MGKKRPYKSYRIRKDKFIIKNNYNILYGIELIMVSDDFGHLALIDVIVPKESNYTYNELLDIAKSISGFHNDMFISYDTPEYIEDFNILLDRYTYLIKENKIKINKIKDDKYIKSDHLLNMIKDIRLLKMPWGKICRWIGYIQGILLSIGLIDVDKERDITRPIFTKMDELYNTIKDDNTGFKLLFKIKDFEIYKHQETNWLFAKSDKYTNSFLHGKDEEQIIDRIYQFYGEG